jgi:hypothetical protein
MPNIPPRSDRAPCDLAPVINITGAHHHDLMRHSPHHPQIMADEDIADPIAALQIAQQLDDLHLNRHIQRAGRLIQHHQFRPQDHRPGNGDTLTLPARKLMRIARHGPGIEPDLGHDLGHHRAPVAALVEPVHIQPLGNDLPDRHARRQAAERVLEDDLQIRAQVAQRRRLQALDFAAQKQDRAVTGDQPQDGQRQRGLARTRFTDNPQGLTGAHRQGCGIHRLHMANCAPHQPALDRKPDAQIPGLQQGFCLCHHRIGPTLRLGRQQFAGIGMARIGENLSRRALLDDLTCLHHADPVGNTAHHRQIMGNEQKRQILARLQPGQKIQYLRLNGHIQRRGRLIRNQQPWPIGQRHGDHHPLALAARQLMRIGRKPAFGIADPDLAQKLDDPRPCLRPLQPLMQGKAFAKLAFDRMQRIKAGHRLLKDEADVIAAQGSQLALRGPDHLAAKIADRAGDRGAIGQKPHGRKRGDRLSRSRLPDQRHGLAAPDLERHALDRAQRLAVQTEVDGQVADLQQFIAHWNVFRGSKASRTPSKMNTIRLSITA